MGDFRASHVGPGNFSLSPILTSQATLPPSLPRLKQRKSRTDTLRADVDAFSGPSEQSCSQHTRYKGGNWVDKEVK